MPSAARFSSLWTAGRVSGFGPSTLMCPIPVKHTHVKSAADGCPADRHGACKTEPPRDAIGGQIFLALDSRQG